MIVTFNKDIKNNTQNIIKKLGYKILMQQKC